MKLILGLCYLAYAIVKLSGLLPQGRLRRFCKQRSVHKTIEILFVLALIGLAGAHLEPAAQSAYGLIADAAGV